MPKIGQGISKISGLIIIESGSFTLSGPPEIIIPLGFRAMIFSGSTSQENTTL